MTMFRKGDKVRCIKSSPEGFPRPITAGDQYTVEMVSGKSIIDGRSGKYVLPREVDQWFLATDFEKVTDAPEPEDTPVEAVLRVIHLDHDDFPACGAGEQMRKVGEPDHTTATKHYFLEWNSGIRSEPGADVCGDCALIATEPEDTDDVEPEPLKEGDWALAWVVLASTAPLHHDSEIFVDLPGTDYARSEFIRADAIVRPDAGQVPPWIKPAQCTSLHHIADDNVYVRCVEDSDHSSDHGAGYMGGRVNWSGAGDASAIQGGAS